MKIRFSIPKFLHMGFVYDDNEKTMTIYYRGRILEVHPFFNEQRFWFNVSSIGYTLEYRRKQGLNPYGYFDTNPPAILIQS